MRRLVFMLLVVIIIMVFTSCTTGMIPSLLEDRKMELLEHTEELQLNNDELKKINNELTKKVEEQKEVNNQHIDQIKKYEDSINENNQIIMNYEAGLGFTVDEFMRNNISYYLLSNYDSFKKIDSGEYFDGSEPFYSHNNDKDPIIVYELYNDEKIKCSVHLILTYKFDTHKVSKITISYGNYKENKEGREIIDNVISDISKIFIMSSDGPIIYSDKVDEMAKEFIEKKVWDDGNVTMTVLDFPKFGTIFIE